MTARPPEPGRPGGAGPTREARIQRTRAWLRYAMRDLQAARDALRPDSLAHPYHAAFWAQQAAEKALKGALAYAGVPFERTHDLNELVAALPADWQTRRAAGALGALSLYGVDTRYPDLGETEPTARDAHRAITEATAVVQAVRRDLEAHGFPFPAPQGPPQPPQSPQPAGSPPISAQDPGDTEPERADRTDDGSPER